MGSLPLFNRHIGRSQAIQADMRPPIGRGAAVQRGDPSISSRFADIGERPPARLRPRSEAAKARVHSGLISCSQAYGRAESGASGEMRPNSPSPGSATPRHRAQ